MALQRITILIDEACIALRPGDALSVIRDMFLHQFGEQCRPSLTVTSQPVTPE